MRPHHIIHRHVPFIGSRHLLAASPPAWQLVAMLQSRTPALDTNHPLHRRRCCCRCRCCCCSHQTTLHMGHPGSPLHLHFANVTSLFHWDLRQKRRQQMRAADPASAPQTAANHQAPAALASVRRVQASVMAQVRVWPAWCGQYSTVACTVPKPVHLPKPVAPTPC